MIDRFAVNKYEISAPILSEPKMFLCNIQTLECGIRWGHRPRLFISELLLCLPRLPGPWHLHNLTNITLLLLVGDTLSNAEYCRCPNAWLVRLHAYTVYYIMRCFFYRVI